MINLSDLCIFLCILYTTEVQWGKRVTEIGKMVPGMRNIRLTMTESKEEPVDIEKVEGGP